MNDTKGLIGFIEWLIARKLADGSIKQYGSYYRLLEKDLGEKEFTQGFIDRFVIKHPSNISRSFLKNLFDYYEIKDLKIPKIKGRRKIKKRRTISPQEIKVLGSWLYNRGKRFGLMFELSFYCALRRDEVIRIKIRDFFLEDYSSDTSKSCKLKIHGKGSKERYVIVPPKVMSRLINWMQQKQKIPIEKKLFGVGRSKWQDIFKDAIKKTGSYNYTLHDLRRSRATHWLNDGIDLVRVMRRLGHSDVSNTQKYINPEEEKELKNWEEEF